MAQCRQSGTDRLASRSHLDAGEQINIRIPQKSGRLRRTRPQRRLPSAVVIFSLTLLAVFILSLIAFYRLSDFREKPAGLDEEGTINQSEPRPRLERSLAFKELRFGQFSDGSGRDSRYWDGDDRRRDNDYSEEDATDRNSGSDASKRKLPEERKVESFYNEGGREELDSYRKKYEVALKDDGRSKEGDMRERANPLDEYDDGIDEQDEREDGGAEENGIRSDDGEVVSAARGDGIRKRVGADVDNKGVLLNSNVKSSVEFSKDAGDQSQMEGAGDSGSTVSKSSFSGSEKKAGLKRKPNHHKTSRLSCEIKFLNSTDLLVEPLENKKFSRFLLEYTKFEERSSGAESWEPRFAGHQTPLERNQSYFARDQKIKCGFIKGPPGSPSTGFDLAKDDIKYMGGCHIAVSSCIFGNSDHIRTPHLKTITRLSRKNVCFIMFVDEITLQTLLSEGQKMDSLGFIGLWKIVVVRNLPFPDMRRVGKIPKFLTHQLFPSARYSIWLDSKLRLQNDPYLILEYFLWRKGYEYAISNHYDRHCVWEEVAQNKKLNKYNHTVIDEQFAFYQSDGLKRFDPSDPNRLLPSYVPEGSFIVRAHTPMSNLFSCLWFNEVDNWTPRDQLSFSYTYLKLRRMNPGKNFYLNMFKDCERRTIAKLFHHRAEDKINIPVQ